MIVKKKAKFILSGSSARKLKRGGANLLGGRAQICAMHPLTEWELGDRFLLEKALKWGTLPEVYLAEDDKERTAILKAYTQVYLKEELVRNLEPFRLFLEICAQMNTKVINHSAIAREANVDYKTVQSYFSILEETYLGFYLPVFHESLRKSQLSHPKFYLFDLGVTYALMRNLDRSVNPRTASYGVDFEAFFVTECHRLNSYGDKDYRLSYYATKGGVEIDVILSSATVHYVLEVKSAARSALGLARPRRSRHRWCSLLALVGGAADSILKPIGSLRHAHGSDLRPWFTYQRFTPMTASRPAARLEP